MNPSLAELKDIHLPAASPWWELAYGWWLLLAFLLVLLFWGVPRLKRWLHVRREKRAVLASVQAGFKALQQDFAEHQNVHQLLAELSILLRRVALTLFEAEQVQGLTGDAWLDFLDKQWRQKPELSFQSPKIAQLLSEGAYRPSDNASVEDAQALLALVQQWLDEVVKQHV